MVAAAWRNVAVTATSGHEPANGTPFSECSLTEFPCILRPRSKNGRCFSRIAQRYTDYRGDECPNVKQKNMRVPVPKIPTPRPPPKSAPRTPATRRSPG